MITERIKKSLFYVKTVQNLKRKIKFAALRKSSICQKESIKAAFFTHNKPRIPKQKYDVRNLTFGN